MNADEERDRHVEHLVSRHLREQAARVDARSFAAGVMRARAAQRLQHRRRVRLASAVAIAASLIIAAVMVFPRRTSFDRPPQPDLCLQVISGASSGFRAVTSYVQQAAQSVEKLTLPTLCFDKLPAPDEEVLDSLRMDVQKMGDTMRKIIGRTLANAGLIS